MSAAELFVWDLEEKMGISLPVANVIAHVADSIGLGALAVLPMGVAAGAVGATGALVNGSIELTKDFGKGVSDVINIMNQENQERLRLEQEWINQIREEREKAFNQINAYIASMVELSNLDIEFDKVSSVEGVEEKKRNLISKRENRIEQIRKLRDRAIRSRDIEEIAACSEAASKIADGLVGEVQEEVVFFAKLGVDVSKYGSLHDDAIKMALAIKNDVVTLQLKSLDESNVTLAMVQRDFIMFEDCLSSFLCEDGLNDRQLRDILAIKQDLKKINENEDLSLDIKSKRIATLFSTYNKRQKSISAELSEMSDYYNEYLRYTFDIPEETSIGIAAAKKRVSTYFIKCNDLLQQLKRAKLENRLDARLKHFCHYRLLIIDELGYLPIDKEDSNLFFQLIDMRYEKKSTILTTNMNFNEWDGIFFDAVVANAIMDRVLHHAHVIPISGKSYRLKDHLKQTD